MSKYKPVLVLGSNSFAGSNFIFHLIKNKFQVIGISRRKELEKDYLSYKNIVDYKKYFKFVKIDINKNPNKVVTIVKKFKTSVIVNFMAQGMVEQSWDAPEDWFMTNLVTQSKIIKQIHNFKFIKKYINFSTPEVYGNNSKWQRESFDFMPTTPYAISRASFDLYLKNMYENFNFPIIITRASNIYGPTQQLFRIIPRTILFGLNKTKLIIDGDGKTTRSFIHMNDVSKALLKIIDKGKNGETYHISSNDLITIDALVKKICKVLGINLEISYGPERVGKDKYYKLKTTKIRKLGWKDIISLEEGIIETSNWLKHINKKIIKKDNIYYKHIK